MASLTTITTNDTYLIESIRLRCFTSLHDSLDVETTRLQFGTQETPLSLADSAIRGFLLMNGQIWDSVPFWLEENQFGTQPQEAVEMRLTL